jgi:perosamine synthetase
VVYQGATPIFADVAPDTLNLDMNDVERRITPRTRAILPVDFAGHPADLDAAMALASRHQLTVIEDASHSLGATFRGGTIGSIAHLTIFSFHPVKHLTTGEGGMVTTSDPDLARKLRMFRNHGIEADARARQLSGEWHYDMAELGYNYRLTDIACALGLSQLPRLPANIARRREIARRYNEALSEISGIRLPAVHPDVEPAWHLFPIRVAAGIRDRVFRSLRAEGIGVNVHYVPVHFHSYYRRRFGDAAGRYPVAETASTELISLPMFHGMTDTDIDDVANAVRKVMRWLE